MYIIQKQYIRCLVNFDPKNNSIGFLRLTCSLLVIFAHTWNYGGYGQEPLARISNNQIGTGRVSVDIFFILSGFLISMSWCNAQNWRVFLWHRFLRIFPAYWVCLLATGIAIACIFRGSPDFSYICKSALLLNGVQTTIPGVFEGNPGGNVVNSSLWTLPWEIKAYIILFILAFVGLLKKHRHFLVLLFLGIWTCFVVEIYSYPGLTTSPAITSGYRLLSFFFAGMLFFAYREKIILNWMLMIISIASMVISVVAGKIWLHYSGGLFYTIAPIPLAYSVFFLADSLPFKNINNQSDISYGLYIYGTLVINLIASFGLSVNYVTFLIIILGISIPVSYLSWIIIERPSLKLKKWKLHLKDSSTKLSL
jgi:peptidoglycan/LPS O-acetylase OafA/YrhL